MVTGDRCVTQEEFRSRFGYLYDAVIEQTQGRDFKFNPVQLLKFMRILEFFSQEAEKPDALWDTLQLIPDEKSGSVSMSYEVFEITQDRIEEFCEVMQEASELAIFVPDDSVICVGCEVPDVFFSSGGLTGDGSDMDGLPNILRNRNFYIPPDDDFNNDELFKEMCRLMVQYHDEELESKDPEDYVENDEQSLHFFNLMEFIQHKIIDSGGTVSDVDLERREGFAEFTATLPELELEGEEVREFCGLLRQAFLIEFSPTLDNQLLIDFKVKDFFVHK